MRKRGGIQTEKRHGDGERGGGVVRERGEGKSERERKSWKMKLETGTLRGRKQIYKKCSKALGKRMDGSQKRRRKREWIRKPKSYQTERKRRQRRAWKTITLNLLRLPRWTLRYCALCQHSWRSSFHCSKRVNTAILLPLSPRLPPAWLCERSSEILRSMTSFCTHTRIGHTLLNTRITRVTGLAWNFVQSSYSVLLLGAEMNKRHRYNRVRWDLKVLYCSLHLFKLSTKFTQINIVSLKKMQPQEFLSVTRGNCIGNYYNTIGYFSYPLGKHRRTHIR